MFKFAGGQVPLGELLDQLKNRNINAVADSTALVQLAERFLLQPYIFAAAVHHEDLIDREALKAARQSLREEVVLSQLRQQKVVASIAIAPEAVRRYYDEQTEHFRRRDQIDVAEVLVETEEEALAVRRQIEAGAAIADIAQERSQRRGARARGGVFPMEKTSDLVSHILAAQPDELVGPVQVHDGFSVFKIVRRQPGERLPFAQVRRQIVDMLRRAEERERFQTYIATLRQQYADRIQIDQQQLSCGPTRRVPHRFLNGPDAMNRKYYSRWSRVWALAFGCLALQQANAQAPLGHRLQGDRIIVDQASYWRHWTGPSHVVDVHPDGTVKPHFFRHVYNIIAEDRTVFAKPVDQPGIRKADRAIMNLQRTPDIGSGRQLHPQQGRTTDQIPQPRLQTLPRQPQPDSPQRPPPNHRRYHPQRRRQDRNPEPARRNARE